MGYDPLLGKNTTLDEAQNLGYKCECGFGPREDRTYLELCADDVSGAVVAEAGLMRLAGAAILALASVGLL